MMENNKWKKMIVLQFTKRKKRLLQLKNSGINYLPENVYSMILVRLPLKDIVSTSLLSQEWRYRWRVIPDLVFNDASFPSFDAEPPKDFQKRLVNFVNQYLLLHNGSIQKFEFSFALDSTTVVDTWINFLQKSTVKVFILRLGGVDTTTNVEYIVHSSLFRCNTLTELVLSDCKVRIPSWIRGFGKLTVLELIWVTFIGHGHLEVLLSNCPLLESLRLEYCSGCERIKLCNRNLHTLSLNCTDFECLVLSGSPRLSYININSSDKFSGNGMDESCNLINVFSGLHELEDLTLWGPSLQILSTDGIPTCFPVAFENLTCLDISVNLNCLQEITSAFCLTRSCPLLESLSINPLHNDPAVAIGDFWEARHFLPCSFKALKSFNMRNIEGEESVMKFIELVLENSPILEKAKIKCAKGSNAPSIYKGLLSLRRVSACARIIC